MLRQVASVDQVLSWLVHRISSVYFPGGFFVFGCMIALINKISKGKAIKKKEFGCAGCPGCGKASCSGKEAAAK